MQLAGPLDGEIVGVDSMQVYRGLDIGTAKPGAADRAAVPHHMIDVVEPGTAYSVAEFQDAGRAALDEIVGRRRTAIICGGSGLHFRALVDPLEFPPTDDELRAELEAIRPEELVDELIDVDPEAARVVDLSNPRRVVRAVEIHRLTDQTPSERAGAEAALAVRRYRARIDFVALGVDPGDRLEQRVTARLDSMLEAGWPDEARRLAPDLGPTARLALGYRELIAVAEGEISLRDARAEILRATLALAKRQRTFFRRDPRIRWLPWHDEGERRLAAATEALEEAGVWNS